ncbi:hypothetical protein QYM36_003650, partial [Artemia franciscana]
IDLSGRHKEDEYPAAVPLSSVLRYYSESDQKSDESCVLNDDFSDIDEFVTDEMLSELSSLPSDDLSLLDSPSKTPPQFTKKIRTTQEWVQRPRVDSTPLGLPTDIDLSERHKEDEYPAAVPLSSVLRYYSESDQKSDESCVLNDDFSDIDEFVTDEMLSELSSLPSDDLSLLDSPSKTPPQSLPVSSTDAMIKDSKKEKKNGSNGVPTPSCGTQPHIKSECPTPDPLAANAGTTVPSVTVKDEPSTPNGGESMNNCENSGSNNCATLSGQSGNTSSGPDIKPNVCGPGGGMNPMMGPNNVESNPMDNFLNDPPMNRYFLNMRKRRTGSYPDFDSAGYITQEACKAEDEGSDSDSNEDESQWTNNSNPSDAQEEYSPEFIMKYGSKYALTPAQLARLGSGTAQLVDRPRLKALTVPAKMFQDRLLRKAEHTPMLCDFGDSELPIHSQPTSIDPTKKLRLAVPLSSLSNLNNKKPVNSGMESSNDLFPDALEDSSLNLPPTPTSPICDPEYESLFS